VEECPRFQKYLRLSMTKRCEKIIRRRSVAIVLPPFLRANLDPLVIVNGKCNLALIETLSPGFAILLF
jgi:hypothetical protein